MQTFLPDPDFFVSASILDYRRLGKQRVEARQIYNALTGKSKGWINHPATKMWRGHENALAFYHNAMIFEWKKRGYNNGMGLLSFKPHVVFPPWLGDPKFHASHRSNLLRKDYEFYKKFNWQEPDDLPYVWPVS